MWNSGAMAIIITGAGSGIGAGLAVSYLEDGFDVLLADLDEAAATEVADAAAGLPGTAVPVACDVREPDDVRATVDLALTRFGSITAMVNNAGISVAGHSHAMELAHWERAVDVNLRGVIHGVHAVLPHMVHAGRGQIVNVASLAGLVPTPALAAYSATKAAVVAMTLSLRAEYSNSGVQVNVVCPGFTDTPLLDSLGPADLPEVPSPMGSARDFAETLPGGVYQLDHLIADIREGLREDRAIIVAPEMARQAWQAFRADPERYLAAVTIGV